MTSDNIEFRHCHGLLNIKSTTEFENQCFRNVVLSSEWQKWSVQDIRDEYTYWRQNPALRTISCYTRRQDNYTRTSSKLVSRTIEVFGETKRWIL